MPVFLPGGDHKPVSGVLMMRKRITRLVALIATGSAFALLGFSCLGLPTPNF
jgi:hypothetical protein